MNGNAALAWHDNGLPDLPRDGRPSGGHRGRRPLQDIRIFDVQRTGIEGVGLTNRQG